jgi:hypothetical protein
MLNRPTDDTPIHLRWGPNHLSLYPVERGVSGKRAREDEGKDEGAGERLDLHRWRESEREKGRARARLNAP